MHLIAVGTRMPVWVENGFADYAKRLPREWGFRLVEIPASKGAKKIDVGRRMRKEAERMRAAIPPDARVIALDERGREWSTQDLAGSLGNWLQQGRDVVFLVGGADGLDSICREQAEMVWSLSRLTFPHPLVRVIVAEQLYRAWSILQHHPYHRA